MREVSIRCSGADYLDIDELKDFQKDLKTLTKENYEKLKAVILRHGFSEPASVWKNEGKYYILNAHQRIRVLKGLRSEGYFVPKIPVNWVEAKDKKEAKEKVLALTSQYGQITEEGASQFMIDAEIDFSFLEQYVRFPEVSLDYFKIENEAQPYTEPITEKERTRAEDPNFKQLQLVFGPEEFETVMSVLEDVKSSKGLDNNSDAVLELCNAYKPVEN